MGHQRWPWPTIKPATYSARHFFRILRPGPNPPDREGFPGHLRTRFFSIGYKDPVDLPTGVTRLFGRRYGGDKQRTL
eukprot:scaffold33797_cov59-Phaeocystis_antarctica.AAC.2